MKLANQQQLEIVNDLVIKSTNDPNFKKELIKNPKKIIEENYSFKVYDDVKVVVEDQSDDNTIFFNIPRKPELDEMELTDAELEHVSGGSTPGCAAVGLGIAACAIYDFGCGMISGLMGR